MNVFFNVKVCVILYCLDFETIKCTLTFVAVVSEMAVEGDPIASRRVIFALRILERQTLVNLVQRELCRTTYVLLGQESMRH